MRTQLTIRASEEFFEEIEKRKGELSSARFIIECVESRIGKPSGTNRPGRPKISRENPVDSDPSPTPPLKADSGRTPQNAPPVEVTGPPKPGDAGFDARIHCEMRVPESIRDLAEPACPDCGFGPNAHRVQGEP